MKYKTVKEVVEFLAGLVAEELDDFALEITFEFYLGAWLVCKVRRDMYSKYTEIPNEIFEILSHRIESVVVENSGCRICFDFNLASPSSI